MADDLAQALADAADQLAARTPTSGFLTIPEVATYLRVSERTVWRWIHQHRLEAHRIGPKTTRIQRTKLEDFLASLNRET